MASYPALELRYAPGPGAGALQDLLYAELDAFEPIAIQEHETGDGWTVFFRTASRRDAAMHLLDAGIGGHVLDLKAVDVDDEDWARRSQAALTAITAGRITVAPPWDVPNRSSLITNPKSLIPNPESRIPDPLSNPLSKPSSNPSSDPSSNRSGPPASSDPLVPTREPIVIVIEPSMGFGTGHHETTRLCLQLLQRVDLSGRRVIDVGTGSGVLAIAASMLGAAHVVAVDNDPDALINARENIERNGGGAIDVVEADLGSLASAPAAVVTANLTAAVLVKHGAALLALVAPGGRLIVSGFGPPEVDDVVAAFGGRDYEAVVEKEWTALLFSI